ncbi:MAG: hypothetical protein R6X20_04930 [Phycisphaerae bacterium]
MRIVNAFAAVLLLVAAAALADDADEARQRLLDLRRKQFEAARGEERKAAGEALLDALLERAETQEEAGDTTAAAALYREARSVAKAAGSGRLPQIEQAAEALARRADAATLTRPPPPGILGAWTLPPRHACRRLTTPIHLKRPRRPPTFRHAPPAPSRRLLRKASGRGRSRSWSTASCWACWTWPRCSSRA